MDIEYISLLYGREYTDLTEWGECALILYCMCMTMMC